MVHDLPVDRGKALVPEYQVAPKALGDNLGHVQKAGVIAYKSIGYFVHFL